MNLIRLAVIAGAFCCSSQTQFSHAQLASKSPIKICSGEKVYFDGDCRGQAYFDRFRKNGNEIVGYSGCSTQAAERAGKSKNAKNCGAFAIITEQTGENTYQSLTLSEKSPMEIRGSTGKKQTGALSSKSPVSRMPTRNGKAVIARSIVSTGSKNGGAVTMKVTAQLVDDDGKYQTVSEQDLLLSPHATVDRNQDQDVTGTFCVWGGIEPESEGNAQCSCFGDEHCGLNSSIGRNVVKTGSASFDFCEKTSEYDEVIDGNVIGELELKLSRQIKRVSSSAGKTKARGASGIRNDEGLVCYNATGYAYTSVIQAYSTAQNSEGSCQGQVSVTAGIQKNTCRAAARGFAGAVAGAESISVSMGSKFGVHGDIMNNAIAAAKGYASFSKRATDIRRSMGPVCSGVGQDVASVMTHPFFCEELSVTSCEGTHSGVPVVVTRASDGAQCNATAQMECTSSGEDDTSMISSQCECTVTSEPQVDEASCRPA